MNGKLNTQIIFAAVAIVFLFLVSQGFEEAGLGAVAFIFQPISAGFGFHLGSLIWQRFFSRRKTS